MGPSGITGSGPGGPAASCDPRHRVLDCLGAESCAATQPGSAVRRRVLTDHDACPWVLAADALPSRRGCMQPESLALQVRVLNAVTAAARRTVSFVSFAVPQYQREESFSAPLAELAAGPGTEFNIALVPYHAAEQAPGTTVRRCGSSMLPNGRSGRQPRVGHLHRMRDGPRGPGRGSGTAGPASRDRHGRLGDRARACLAEP